MNAKMYTHNWLTVLLAEMNAKMYLAWTCTTPHKLAYSLHTCSFLLSPWIGPEVPSEAITLARPWMGGERYGKKPRSQLQKEINC